MSLEICLDKNFKRAIPFIASDIFSLMCFAKDNFSSKYKPKCFVNDFLATGMLLKSREG